MMSGLRATGKEQQYKEVRGLTRGLELIRALNRMPGGFASTSELARMCGMHRTTTKRILETLRIEGLVHTAGREGQYHLHEGVLQLSDGFRNDRWIAEVASPLLKAAVRELMWPSELATMQAGWMIVRESSHRWSMLSQHQTTLGRRMPLLQTAAGRAYLAACSPAELQCTLGFLECFGNGADMESLVDVRAVIETTQERGFALNDGEWSDESSFAAVAVPVFSAGRLLGALNLVFPKNAVTLEDMANRYVPRLKSLALTIGAQSSAYY
jgi:IclR family mhp operon transcriptional activator